MKLKLAGLLLGSIAFSAFGAGAPERIERGNLVIEGVPEIPAGIAERMNQYQQTRSADFEGWLPGDAGLLITTRFGETAQVHRVRAPLAMREQLTFFPEPVRGAAPSPDGKGFLYRKDIGGNEFYQIFWFDFKSGATRRLTDGQSRNTGGQWSNDGRRFTFSTTRRNGRDTDIHVHALAWPESRPVVEQEGSWSVLDWSPDDRRLLVEKYISITESELYLVDIDSRKLTRFHPAEQAIAFGDARFSRDGRGVYYVSDEGREFRQLRYEDFDGGRARVLSADIPWDIEGLALSRGGTYLAYVANVDGSSRLFLRDLKRDAPIAVPALPHGVIEALEFSHDGRQLALALSSARSAGDVYAFRVGQQELVRWTRSETGGLDAATFTQPQLVHFESFDQLRIPAFYYRPAGKGPFPVLINIHGGPESQSRPWFSAITEFWVRELGLAVLVPNVRGSAGYGKSYLRLDNAGKREDSVRDIGALLDWIGRQSELDASRVGVIGGSYGGYMVLASMTRYNDRLRAGVDIVGISNFVTFLTNTQDYRRDLRRAEYGDERDPDMRALLERISPTTNAHKITKPLFVVQGANDPRVPASEAEQMVATIRQQGGEVWYLLARDEGHGFRKKSNRDYYLNATTLFLQQQLLGAARSPDGGP